MTGTDRREHNHHVLKTASKTHAVKPLAVGSFVVIRPEERGGRVVEIGGTDLIGDAAAIRAAAAELASKAERLLQLAADYKQIAGYVEQRDTLML